MRISREKQQRYRYTMDIRSIIRVRDSFIFSLKILFDRLISIDMQAFATRAVHGAFPMYISSSRVPLQDRPPDFTKRMPRKHSIVKFPIRSNSYLITSIVEPADLEVILPCDRYTHEHFRSRNPRNPRDTPEKEITRR